MGKVTRIFKSNAQELRYYYDALLKNSANLLFCTCITFITVILSITLVKITFIMLGEKL